VLCSPASFIIAAEPRRRCDGSAQHMIPDSEKRRIRGRCAEKNLYMLDSPVSGGPGGAASGKMAIWAGGDEQIFNRHKPVLDAMGDQAAYIGLIGAGTIAKLVHNCTSAVMGVALAEVFTIGVDPLELWEAVRQGATGRQRTFDRLGGALSGQHDPGRFRLAPVA
jgi:3-hydroxyisobutyrate dehydrogenase